MGMNEALMFLDQFGSNVPAAVVAGGRLVVTAVAIERSAVEELLLSLSCIVRPASHPSFVPQKTRVAPIQALARPHGVSPFRKELTPDQQFGQTR